VSLPLQTIRPQLPAQLLTGPVCSVKMLRDRYKKWGINDKNARPRRVAVTTPATQTALLHSPRFMELNDDESPVAQEHVSTQDEHGLLFPRMVLSGLLPGSPRAALLTLDSRIHDISNGLSYWGNEVLIGPQFSKIDPDSNLSRKSPGTKRALGRRCLDSAIGLIRSKNLWRVLETILVFSQYQFLDWVDWLEGRPFEQCRILWLCCEYAAQELGPQHPVTLICSWAARGLPFEDLTSISAGIFRIHISQLPLVKRDLAHEHLCSSDLEEWFELFLRFALDTQQVRLHAVAAKSAS
jgi:hypothetical protein